jgi:hypothetical protein
MSLSSKDEIPKVIAKGLVERIGEPSSPIKHEKYAMPLCVRHRIMAEALAIPFGLQTLVLPLRALFKFSCGHPQKGFELELRRLDQD